MLLHQWDIGTIRLDLSTHDVVVDDEAISWYRGVIGERRVGSILELLTDSHTVLHSVPVGTGSSDIDHVVIGRAGVFSINTKYSPGKTIWSAGYGLYVDGHKQHYVRNSVAEAQRAGDMLSAASGLTVPVTALLVFVDPGPITRKDAAGGGVGDPEVRVLSDNDLSQVFMDRPVFSEEQIARIAAAAVRPETWHQSPSESTVGRHITREFEALEDAVGPHLARAFITPRKTPVPSMPSPSVHDRVGCGAAGPAPRLTKTSPPTRSRVRKYQSATETFVGTLLLRIAGLLGFWVYVNMITGQ